MSASPPARTRLPGSRELARDAEDAGPDEGDAEDDRADLARREADGGHAGARSRSPSALALGAGVADHEGRDHRGGREPGRDVEAGPRAADDDADVDDALAPAVEDAVHEGAQRARRAGGAGHGTVEHVERRRRSSRRCRPAATARTRPARPPAEAMAKPMSVSMFGRQPGARHGERERLDARPDAAARYRARRTSPCSSPSSPGRAARARRRGSAAGRRARGCR